MTIRPVYSSTCICNKHCCRLYLIKQHVMNVCWCQLSGCALTLNNILFLLDTSSDVMNKIDKSCKDLNSPSTVFHIKDFNKLIKNQNSEIGESQTFEEVLTKMGTRQEKILHPQGYGKGKGKQKPVKSTSSSNMAKVKVRYLSNISHCALALAECLF